MEDAAFLFLPRAVAEDVTAADAGAVGVTAAAADAAGLGVALIDLADAVAAVAVAEVAAGAGAAGMGGGGAEGVELVVAGFGFLVFFLAGRCRFERGVGSVWPSSGFFRLPLSCAMRSCSLMRRADTSSDMMRRAEDVDVSPFSIATAARWSRAAERNVKSSRDCREGGAGACERMREDE